jgi:N-carbamoyl-L-amino-acid hydrolase
MTDESSTLLTIDQDRFHADFDALSSFGATDEGGVNRPAFSAAHQAARRWFAGRAEEAGLVVDVDGASNRSALLTFPGAEKTLLIGSHLDSVPAGGRFDGAFGVMAALEVLRTVKEAGVQLSVNLKAIDFTDEESHYVEFLGSRAFTGKLPLTELQAPHVGSMRDAIAGMGLDLEAMANCGRDPQEYVGYLELHIEQGPRLINSATDIGIVESIVGIRSHRLVFTGQADHAGTTPMEIRRNAGLGASAFTLALHELLKADFTDCVGNVGSMILASGVTNVVAKRAEVDFEFRFPEDHRGDALETHIKDTASSIAERFDLEFEFIPTGRARSVQMDPALQRTAGEAAQRLGLSAKSMHSGAGHDAQVMAAFTPACVIFVPSIGGISHNPAEFSTKEDCENGANVLLQTVLSESGR